ncbi:uncharacterized protein NECHADRAFT_82786 [Fusarium vanettenii 77-13-4]|uniref:F-box domain-containing protein n=1 Tax=Fusarium vanettenii (strain ATCC MYA-4622 / CBS 123669 / FGSC 9596 / NRRL 45880 / 77-13-4) TaxID=660122 RepID=C7YWU4_FUSV7|nr:uncharacterized protein NECHADRAFT_82786 [Fusarium vanettenii 77-13-4]EEU43467.1 hypothetical protein NECHADRAFT_82786 [Fusarium vanettenii 77-13-4]
MYSGFSFFTSGPSGRGSGSGSSQRTVDQYGKDRDKKRPLLLDAVMGSQERASRSSSRLLQMPAEILAEIVNLLGDSKSALANLALVNSDCRQLARTSQFAEVTFDYSARSKGLFAHLAKEAGSQTTKPSIAACVRRATFAAHPSRDVDDVLWAVKSSSLSEEDIQTYIKLRNALAHGLSAMPNLEALIWVYPLALDTAFFQLITQSKAQHVKLSRIMVNGPPGSLEPPLLPSTWPVFSSLFRLCSPTLESLRWSYKGSIYSGESHCISFGKDPISFPRLLELQLEFVQLSDVEFSSLFPPHLRAIQLSGEITIEDAAEDLCNRNFPHLEAFAIPRLPLHPQFCKLITDFILRHQHVKKLYIHEADWVKGRDAHLDRVIIPALTGHNFSQLRSLSLAWGGGSDEDDDHIPHNLRIPKKSLLALEALTSLEQLSLAVGNQTGEEAQWAVKHDKLLASLGKLQKLKKLALSRDTYPIPLDEDDRYSDDYYEACAVTDAEIRDAKLRPELDIEEDLEGTGLDDEGSDDDDMRDWTRAHRNRMLSHAERYAAVLPELEWMFCGRWPMGIVRDPKNPAAPVKAVPLSRSMDECVTFLKKTFGCEVSQT